ncbi:MAG TPA: hypothetical protein VF762_10475 [Blastocatellia bacterium]|jgi:hypothetical protein
MFISFTEIWFSQTSAEMQRMKLLVWLRAKCIDAGYKNVRVLGRSVIAKPADASDYVIVAECETQQDYFRLLDVIAELTEGMQKRFIDAGGLKWGESIFFDLIEPKP